MVLCPYIFLITRSSLPPLKLQPTEVASTHWVPLRALLSAQQRTVSYEDVSNRLAHQETGVRRWLLRAMLGQMLFAAIRLMPSESLYCNTPPVDEIPGSDEISKRSLLSFPWSRNKPPPAAHERPLMLWGLTLGVMADFLDLLPPHNALQLWTYPTFTPWDVRLTVWAMSYKFKQRKTREIKSGRRSGPAVSAVEEGLDAVSTPKDEQLKEVGIGGLGSGIDNRKTALDRMGFRSSAVATMLEGYYDIVRKAVAVALIGRVSAFTALLAILWARYRRSR
ncbi:hypothetical protein M8818_006188 [Zalaria obscura]|uniref:Uncharacterized protein n=1 Tax=Zalaria obscura TaxID=2024903 RepID=A0ACC3S7V4_9PEZI